MAAELNTEAEEEYARMSKAARSIAQRNDGTLDAAAAAAVVSACDALQGEMGAYNSLRRRTLRA